tara:strand:- start:1551 stop:1847 length:297 start_codon:yes stop_codon:yes gene_type:complete
MSILDQQLPVSKAMANGRKVGAYEGEKWKSKNISPSQIRYSERDSDLVSGYFGGFDVGDDSRGRVHMYPDNHPVFVEVSTDANGRENIRDSKTAAQIG